MNRKSPTASEHWSMANMYDSGVQHDAHPKCFYILKAHRLDELFMCL